MRNFDPLLGGYEQFQIWECTREYLSIGVHKRANL